MWIKFWWEIVLDSGTGCPYWKYKEKFEMFQKKSLKLKCVAYVFENILFWVLLGYNLFN